MAAPDNKSGKAVGQAYLKRVTAYLRSTPLLPLQADGTLNVSAIAAGADIPRQSLYKNPGIRALLEAEKARQSLASRRAGEVDAPDGPASASAAALPDTAPNQKERLLERRLLKLEQQNAALVAENAELRRQLKTLRLQMGREDMAIETGRRIPAPPDDHA